MQDFARINTWASQFEWARDARATIIANADAYPLEYLKNYHLTTPELPPTGGRWTLRYICPDGLRFQYQSTHTCRRIIVSARKNISLRRRSGKTIQLCTMK